MGQITPEQAEWAVIDRMREMLEDPQGPYLATQSYALFSSILCWVMQHLRIPESQQVSARDKAASALLAELGKERVVSEPWNINSESAKCTLAEGLSVAVAVGFEDHTADRFLKNLRDAMAHGDARRVQPYNHGEVLRGFSFDCRELSNGAEKWRGSIVLLRTDMQRIGCLLASRYCDAMKASDQSGEIDMRAAAMIEDAD